MQPPPPWAPFMAARPRGAGRRAGRAEPGARPPRSPPPPRASLRPLPAPHALPGAAPARAELRAARPGGEGAGTGRAPGGARSNLAGRAAPAARPAPERAKLGAGAGEGGPRRLPGAAEPLRSPTPPLPCPPRPAGPRAPPSGALGWEGTRGAARGGGRGLSRDTCRLVLRVPPPAWGPNCARLLRDPFRGPAPLPASAEANHPKAQTGHGLLPPRGAPALGWSREEWGGRKYGKADTPFSLKASF